MHKIITIILLLSLILLTACSDNSSIMQFDSSNYVELYNYRTIAIDQTYTEITDNDVKRIIELELSIKEAYIEIMDRSEARTEDILLLDISDIMQYYYFGFEGMEYMDKQLEGICVGDSKRILVPGEGLIKVTLLGIYRAATIQDTEFILSHYGFEDFDGLEAEIRSRAAQEIIFNCALDIIWSHSVILDIPDEIQRQIGSDLNELLCELKQQGTTYEQFLGDNGLTEQEIEDMIRSGYADLMLYHAILEREGVTFSTAEINSYRASHEEAFRYSDYDIYGELAEAAVRRILINTISIVASEFSH